MKNKRYFYGIDTGEPWRFGSICIASNLVFYVLSTMLHHKGIKRNKTWSLHSESLQSPRGTKQ